MILTAVAKGLISGDSFRLEDGTSIAVVQVF